VVRYVETIGKYFGNTINRPYAEPFYHVESLGLKDLSSLVT